MKEINSLNDLQEILKTNDSVWMLLLKKGSAQSDCAYDNYKVASEKAGPRVLLVADVNKVKDIHPAYNITSVPTLIQFKKEKLANVIKGCHQPEKFNAIFESAVYVSATGKEEAPAKRVTVYTTPTCTWCNTLKRHLDEYHIRYREVNVASDPKAAEEMVRKSGQQGVPQTDINGQVVVGFDRVRLNSLLGIN